MKSNSKKRRGFTIVEVIISMAVIAIISVGVYNGFNIMIKGTKQGQVRQTSALIGNDISEQIKAVSENKTFNTNADGSSIDLTSNVHLTKGNDGSDYTSALLYFNEDGILVNSTDNYRYMAKVKLYSKKTEDPNSEVISIDEVFKNNSNPDVQNRNVCIIKPQNQSAEIIKKDNNTAIDSVNVDGDKAIQIEITDATSNPIKIGSSELGELYYDIDKDKKQQITIDFKYCTGKIKVEVSNTTKNPFNLFILNGNNVEVTNEKGILHEYRRSQIGSKIGTLYDVNIEIYDVKSVDGFDTKPIFETSSAQNINIK